MTPSKSWTPRLPEPLPAVLVGAGFFLFLAAFSRLGPFAPDAPWLARRALAAQAGPAPMAERVLGGPIAGGGGAKVDALARDLAWLRSQGAGTIVLEAWLDEPPQADARAFEGELRARFEALPAGRARSRGLQVLSETAAELDAPERLSAALKGAQPLLLAFQALPGGGPPLPAALKSRTYEVSLRGEAKTLPAYRPLRLPFEEALLSATTAGAVPAPGEPGRVPAVVCIQGQWVNSLGLEAALLALRLPLQGLRYRWRQGVLNSLELAGLRYPLDGEGRLLLPARDGALPSVSMDLLRRDPREAGKLRGKTVFFRPWPAQLGDAGSFEDQSRLFSAFMERGRGDLGMPPPDGQGMGWCLLGILAVVLGLVYAPVWIAVAAWVLCQAAVLWAFQGRPPALAQALAYAAAALLLGLGWRSQRFRLLRLSAERLLNGMVAAGHQVGWRRRLRRGATALQASYAVVGPRVLMRGAVWEEWMERWGALMDSGTPGEGLGLILAGPGAEEAMAGALLDLRRQIGGISGAVSRGTLSFRVDRSLGASVWQIQGPVKDRALDLFHGAQAGQILVSKEDFLAFGDFVEGRVLGPPAGPGAARELEPPMNILGPKVNLWPGRP